MSSKRTKGHADCRIDNTNTRRTLGNRVYTIAKMGSGSQCLPVIAKATFRSMMYWNGLLESAYRQTDGDMEVVSQMIQDMLETTRDESLNFHCRSGLWYRPCLFRDQGICPCFQTRLGNIASCQYREFNCICVASLLYPFRYGTIYRVVCKGVRQE